MPDELPRGSDRFLTSSGELGSLFHLACPNLGSGLPHSRALSLTPYHGWASMPGHTSTGISGHPPPATTLLSSWWQVPITIVVVLTACSATGAVGGTPPVTGPPSPSIALVGVNIRTPDKTPALNQTIVISGGVIVAIGPNGGTSIPEGAQIVDAGNQWVMPGLFDMHAHEVARDRLVMAGHGIVGVRGMWGTSEHQAVQADVARGAAVGPTLFLASPGHDGPPASWPLTRMVTRPDDAPAAVARVRSEGWAFLKVYDHLPRAAFMALNSIARAEGVRVVGHVPLGVSIDDALTAGMASIEHLTGYGDPLTSPGAFAWSQIELAAVPRLVAATKAAGTWNCPTLAVTAIFARRRGGEVGAKIIENRRRFVRALYDGGARLLIGTDSGIDLVAPGSGLLEEMREFAAAGIPNEAILRLATLEAAEFLGVQQRWGRVAVGFRGDLLLLHGDPAHALEQLAQPAGLILAGRHVDAATLATWRGQ
ncbi:MAG: amidohydrolase family protein [Gemmatimonadales bacterium]|nr:amidohydrolase family protein [Gemmatimonadales bacterium]